MDPAPNLRDRNLRTFSAIILLAVQGNTLSRPAAERQMCKGASFREVVRFVRRSALFYAERTTDLPE
jgi:hypothetical protein